MKNPFRSQKKLLVRADLAPAVQAAIDVAGQLKHYPVHLVNEFCLLVVKQPNADLAWRRLFSAWMCGGIMAADTFLDVPEFGSLWHGTSRQETLGITRIFTLAMVSRWAYWHWRELDDQTLHQNLQYAATDVIGFFGGAGESTLEEFLTTTAQFFADNDESAARESTERRLPFEVDLVVSLAARELGRPLPIPLASLSRFSNLWQRILDGWRPFFDDFELSIQSVLLLRAAEQYMFELYARLGDAAGVNPPDV